MSMHFKEKLNEVFLYGLHGCRHYIYSVCSKKKKEKSKKDIVPYELIDVTLTRHQVCVSVIEFVLLNVRAARFGVVRA